MIRPWLAVDVSWMIPITAYHFEVHKSLVLDGQRCDYSLYRMKRCLPCDSSRGKGKSLIIPSRDMLESTELLFGFLFLQIQVERLVMIPAPA